MNTRSIPSRPHVRSLPRLATLSFLALLLALGALTAPTLAPGLLPRAQAAETTISQGTVTWGIKASWRTYIGTSGTTLDGGVTVNADGTYDWPITDGTYGSASRRTAPTPPPRDDATKTLRLDLAGSAHYVAYPSSEGGYILDSLFKDLHVVISPTEQTIRGTYSGNPREGGGHEDYVDVVLATLDIASADVASSGGRTTWSGVKSYGGPGAFLYPAGTPFDAVSISYTGPGGVPDTGEKLATPGVPTLTPGATWLDTNATEDGRALFASQRYDVMHLVQRSGFGTADAKYVIRTLDATTMQEIGRTDIEAADARQWFQLAFDPATDAIFLADGDPNSTGSQIRRAVYDPATHTYSNDVIADVAPIDTSTSNEVASMTWDATRSELIVMMRRVVTADRRYQGQLSFLHAPADGAGGATWTAEVDTISLPDAEPVTGTLSVASGFASGKTSSSNRVAVLRDGSYLVVPGGSFRRSGSTDTFAIPAMHLVRDPQATGGVTLTYVPDTSIPPQSATVANNYQGVTTAADGSALLYGYGSVQYVDVVDGQVTTLNDFAIPPGTDSVQNVAVGDPERGVDYVFFNGTLVLGAWTGHQLATLYRLDGVNRGGLNGYSYPLVVTPDGAVVLVVKDAATGNIGLRRFDLVGITATPAMQPDPATVTLGTGVASKQAIFTSTSTGGTGDVRRQWQAKPPGATAFADLAGETGENLMVAATPGMEGTAYRALYTNAAGTVASAVATLTVEFSPRVVSDTRAQTVTEGADATFHASLDANPAPTLTWQRRVGGFWQDVASDDDLRVETTDGVTALTVTGTNTDQSGSLFRVKATNDVATTYTAAARLTVNPSVTVPADGLDLDGVVLEWSGSAEVQSAPPFGSSNYLSAGVSAGDQASYAASAGDVSVLQVAADGSRTPATYATRAAHIAAGGEQLVRLDGGTAHVAADGSAVVDWDGAFSVNFYDGLVPFTLTDPELTVDADGTGTLTADLSGYASSMADPSQREPLPPVADVTVATFAGVDLDPTGSVTVTPDYAGVELDVPAGQTPQSRSAAGWGSWPQEFVDYQFATGLSSYWYSSGGSADARKAPAPFTVDLTDAEPIDGSGTAPEITAQPASTSATVGTSASVAVGASGDGLGYQWQKRIGSLWIDLPDETGAVLELDDVVLDDAGSYRVKVTNGSGSVTSAPAIVTVLRRTSTIAVTAPAASVFGRTATVTVAVPGRTGTVALTGAGARRTAALVRGVATFALPRTLAAGTYRLGATWGGDAENAAATAPGRTLVVGRAPVTIGAWRVTRTPTSRRTGRVVLTLRASTGATVTGRVVVAARKGSTTQRRTVVVRNGRATVVLPRLARGVWRLTATYRASANLGGDTASTRIRVRR